MGMLKWFLGPHLYFKVNLLSTYAAALAFYFVLSLVPFLIVSFTLATRLSPLDLRDTLGTILRHLLPTENDLQSRQILVAIERISHGGLATVGFILAIYTSFNFFIQIVRTLHFIFDDPRGKGLTTLLHALKSALLFLIWMALLVIISFCFVLTPVAENTLSHIYLVSLIGVPAAYLGRDLAILFALFVAFYLTFILVPSRSYAVKLIVQGCLIAAFGWVLCSLTFAFVLPKIWNSNAVYGALGSVVAILLWGQACAWSVILGACWIVRFSPQRRVMAGRK